ncbi:MAG: DUF1156 domain-containing protein [Pirellulales bacterium]
MTTYRKKLIEVALPLEAINKASAREKSIRHGHPSTLHLWWARRPLAACRAVLFGSLVDDPDSDPMFAGDENLAASKRAELFTLIEELVQWENSNNPRVINRARAEIARCVAVRKIEGGELATEQVVAGQATAHDIKHMLARPEDVNAFLAEHAPPVLDPFCGGGSIPLEAQRLGLRAYASDLNPVAVLITKALIEIPPKFAGRPPVNPEWQKKSASEKAATTWQGAQGLAEDVRYCGKWMRDEAEKRIGHLYPKVEVTAEMAQDRPDLLPYVGQQLTVIAWLWARTVASPNPVANGAHVPLVRSFWLSTKAAKKVWIEPIIEPNRVNYRFEIRYGNDQSRAGTVGKAGDTCLLTGSPITREHIREEGMAGRIKTRLMTIVAEGRSERVFLAPNAEHESASGLWKPPNNLCDTEIIGDSRYLTPVSYGMTKHRHLFTDRQLAALATFADLVSEARARVLRDSDGSREYADAVALFLGLLVSKCADYWSNLCVWRSDPKNLGIGHVFSRQALSMAWDFAEGNPFSASSGSWGSSQRWTELVLKESRATAIGDVNQISAKSLACPVSPVISTDPPYYDNVPYADLSDFFYVWLRRCLQPVFPELLRTVLVPKSEELVADPFRQGGKEAARQFFERGMGQVFEKMRDTTDAQYPATIYYAFKQTEDADESAEDADNADGPRSSTGWETFLQGLAETGWQIDGTWPIRTEMGNRTRSMASNALASSIVLVCRPRPSDAPLATRKEFMNALRRELPEALKSLQQGNIAPVDLAQAAIGPGMAVFTRYAKVIETNGLPMAVRAALGIINQVLDEVLAEQEGEFDGDTRWALAWFEQFGVDEGPFGVAETLSKAKNTAVNGLVEAGVIRAKGGKVRLVSRSELNGEWDPAGDRRLTVWEATQHLIRTLETDGESAAAALMHKLGGYAETARDLAYRLYHVCERKKWAEEALAYNGLVIAWPELTRLAQAERNRPAERQQTLEM